MQRDHVFTLLCLRLAVTFSNCWSRLLVTVQTTQKWWRSSVYNSSFLSHCGCFSICVTMPGMCSVPGCKGYKKARSRGVVFHSLPTRDPGRCRKWLKAIQNPKFDENTPVSKYGNIRVCSQHFKPEDYEPDIQAELMKTTPRKILKSNVIPSVFSGRQQEVLSTSLPAEDSTPAEVKTPSTAAQTSTSVVSGSSMDGVLRWASALTSAPRASSQVSSFGVQVTDVDTASLSPSLSIPITSGAPSTSPQSPPQAELNESLSSVASVDGVSESFHQETELNTTATSKSGKNTEKDFKDSKSKTIVNDSCLMELFKKCQTCGQPITRKKVSHCGAQKKVRWSCLGGHRGIWMSSPHLWEAFPEIHLFAALSVLFSGGTFTQFKKWAKHLHLNFMGHKTFFEIQKAYLSPEMKQMNRTEQGGAFAKGVHQQPGGTLLHISDPLKKMKAKSRRREKGVLSSWLSYEKRSSISLTSTGTCTQDPTALSSLGHVLASRGGKQHQQYVEHQSETTHMAPEVDRLQDSFDEMEFTIEEDECNSVNNRLYDSDNDVKNVLQTTKLRAPGVDEEDVYVPIIPQRSTSSELLLECEEEELEPWQKHTSHVQLKVEDDVGELSMSHQILKEHVGVKDFKHPTFVLLLKSK
uniref:THAP-type domain-containing protein n=1 Tax=Dicentrarchus labrax TaxID=13489 RepID=A0A8C4F8D3_DICLA